VRSLRTCQVLRSHSWKVYKQCLWGLGHGEEEKDEKLFPRKEAMERSYIGISVLSPLQGSSRWISYPTVFWASGWLRITISKPSPMEECNFPRCSRDQCWSALDTPRSYSSRIVSPETKPYFSWMMLHRLKMKFVVRGVHSTNRSPYFYSCSCPLSMCVYQYSDIWAAVPRFRPITGAWVITWLILFACSSSN
jgi:hypothetical protein